MDQRPKYKAYKESNFQEKHTTKVSQHWFDNDLPDMT